MSNQFKFRITKMLLQIVLPPSEIIIKHDHIITSFHQTVNKVAPDEPSPTRHQHPQHLPLQRQWNPPGPGLVSDPSDHLDRTQFGNRVRDIEVVLVQVDLRWIRNRKSSEEEGSDGDSDKKEEKAFREDADYAGGGGFRVLRRVEDGVVSLVEAAVSAK